MRSVLEDPKTHELVRRKARSLARCRGLTEHDIEDLEQDLFLDLLERWPKFDPDKSPPIHFIRKVLRNRAANFLRHRKTDKHRWARRALPLHKIQSESELGLADPLADPRDPRGERREEALQVAELLAGLPPRLRRVCELLGTLTVTEAAQILQTDRANIYRQINEIRCKSVQTSARRKKSSFGGDTLRDRSG